jgi:hypothetical protein
MSPSTRNLIVGSAIVVLLLTITALAGSVNTKNARKSALLSGVNALAASFKYPILEANSLRTEAGKERLKPMLDEVALAGDYRSVMLTDSAGQVMARSDGSLSQATIPIDELPKQGSRIADSPPGLRVTAPVKMGGTTIGYLVVDTKD